MPEKTHGRAGGSCRRGGLKLLLELLRRFVAQRRVQATSIIVLFDERLDVGAEVIQIHIIVSIDLFPLERLYKTLTARIVIRVGYILGNHNLVSPQSPETSDFDF